MEQGANKQQGVENEETWSRAGVNKRCFGGDFVTAPIHTHTLDCMEYCVTTMQCNALDCTHNALDFHF